jgi:hypothetical protein
MSDGYQFQDGKVRPDGDTGHGQAEECGSLAGIIAKFRAAIRSRVPLGYEDETGFHVGIMSPEK